VPFVRLDELVALVRDGDRVGVGGCLFTRVPLAAVLRLALSGRRDLEYVSWGGGLPLELLLAADAVRRIVFCFSSLDVFGSAPRFRRALEQGTVEVEEWNALGMIQGFEAAKQRLPSLPFTIPAGSELLERGGVAPLYQEPLTGAVVAAAPPLRLDALLLHAQRADGDGNVEIAGARGLDLSAIPAARQVLVTVEEIVPRGELGSIRQSVVVPRQFVTAICHHPFGAYPTSCLPYAIADYAALQRMTETDDLPFSPPDGARAAFLAQAAALDPGTICDPGFLRSHRVVGEAAPVSTHELMATCLARRYDEESVCSAGAVSPLAVASYLLAKRTHAPQLTILTTSGGFVDVASRPMLLGLAEALDFRTAVAHCGGDDSYRWFYQSGRVTHEVVTAAQIDRRGRTNNVQVTTPSGRTVRLPGQGGMADVANLHRDFLLYLPRQSPLSLVEEVEIASAARGLVSAADREAAGMRPGRVGLVTDLGAFELDEARGELVLSAVHPGVTVDEVAAASGFEPAIAPDVARTEPPLPDELELLRGEIDPLGLGRLELVPSRDRGPLLAELIAAEERLVEDAIAAAAPSAAPGA
jgi:glutaconate CoA-transferase subunit A